MWWFFAGFIAVWIGIGIAERHGVLPELGFITGDPNMDFAIVGSLLSIGFGLAVFGIRCAIHRRAFDRGRDRTTRVPPMRVVELARSGRRAEP